MKPTVDNSGVLALLPRFQQTPTTRKAHSRLSLRFSSVEYWKTTWWIHIRSVISLSGKSRVKIAEELEVSEPRICHLLNHDSDPRMSTVIRLATAAGFAPHLVLEPIGDLAARSMHGDLQSFDYKSNLRQSYTGFAIYHRVEHSLKIKDEVDPTGMESTKTFTVTSKVGTSIRLY